ncbi:protein unc-13 homolog C-like isoform X2 [Dermacentor albipictus]
MLIPILFVQVGDKYLISSIRDDSVTLTVLPSPQCLLCLLFDCVHVIRLLLVTSGDIELNPGPSDSESETHLNSELLKKILKEQTKTNKTLVALTTNLKQVESTVEGIQAKITTIEQELCRIEKSEQRLEKCDEACRNTTKLVLELTAKVEDLENRSRRNILVYGVKEKEGEDSKELERKVNEEIFKNVLGVEINSIERIHRIGAKNAQRPRPIILRFYNHIDKTKVLSSCFKLKGTEIAISEDFSKKIRDIRAKLWRSAAEAKDSGSKVSLIFDKLKVDGKLYVWDTLRNCRVELSQSTASAKSQPLPSQSTHATTRQSAKK